MLLNQGRRHHRTCGNMYPHVHEGEGHEGVKKSASLAKLSPHLQNRGATLAYTQHTFNSRLFMQLLVYCM
jgi:hypothetical protein